MIKRAHNHHILPDISPVNNPFPNALLLNLKIYLFNYLSQDLFNNAFILVPDQTGREYGLNDELYRQVDYFAVDQLHQLVVGEVVYRVEGQGTETEQALEGRYLHHSQVRLLCVVKLYESLAVVVEGY